MTEQYTAILGDLSALHVDAIFSDKEVEKMIRTYYKGSDKIPAEMFKRTFEKLSEGVATGYGKILKDGVDGDMVYQLKNNVKVFAAFKANHYKDTMLELLVDQDNKKRSWSEFLKEAKKVDADYNRHWLAAEYNMAIRQARGAKQWSTFERDREIYPNLEFLPSQAAEKRIDHQKYYGMILPLNHAFWRTGYPPLDWGCLCGVKQTRQAPTDLPEGETAPVAPQGVAGNAGIEKKVFTASSSYLRGLDTNDKNRVKKFLIDTADLSYEEIYITIGKNKITIPLDADPYDLIENTNFLQTFVKKFKKNWGINSHSQVDGVKNPELNDQKAGNIGDLVTAEDLPLSAIKTAFKKLQGNNQLGKYKSVFLAIDLGGKMTTDNYFEALRKMHGQMKVNPKLQYIMLKNGTKACILDKDDDFATKITKIKKELL